MARCKDRKNLMKEAVVARNAFAAGHSGYAMALKNTGAALSDFGHGEVEDPLHQNENDNELHNQPLEPASKPPPPPPMPIEESLPPPPPPLPNFSPSPSPIKRTISLPANVNVNGPRRVWRGRDTMSIAEEEEEEEENRDHHHHGDGGNVNSRDVKSKGNGFAQKEVVQGTPPMPESKGMAWDYFFMMENMPGSTLTEEDVGNIENVDVGVAQFGENVNVGPDMGVEIEPKTPEKVEEEKVYEEEEEKQIEHAKTAPPEFRRVAAQGSSVRLKKILKDLDDFFLQASESAQEVSKMLEATRLHYHSNFADNRGNPFFLLLFLYATFVSG